MAPPSPPRRRGRAAPPRLAARIATELGWESGSWLVIAWTIVVLALGFGPLALGALLGLEGVRAKLLVALGPVLVCCVFAVLVLTYGRQSGLATWRLWLLAGMFLGLAALAGWGLFVSA